MDTQTTSSLRPRSSLFTVRLWGAELGGDEREVRMQVRHVLTGETRYFRDWSEVEAYLLAKVQDVEDDLFP
jgi:hypothetical protein